MRTMYIAFGKFISLWQETSQGNHVRARSRFYIDTRSRKYTRTQTHVYTRATNTPYSNEANS